MSIEIEEEPVSWFTIACLFTAVAVAFTYRFFGPDSGQPTQRKETAEKVLAFNTKNFSFSNRYIGNFAACSKFAKKKTNIVDKSYFPEHSEVKFLDTRKYRKQAGSYAGC